MPHTTEEPAGKKQNDCELAISETEGKEVNGLQLVGGGERREESEGDNLELSTRAVRAVEDRYEWQAHRGTCGERNLAHQRHSIILP